VKVLETQIFRKDCFGVKKIIGKTKCNRKAEKKKKGGAKENSVRYLYLIATFLQN